MSLLQKLFGLENKRSKYDNTKHYGMWVCPNCDIALPDNLVERIDHIHAWYCCPACGYQHKDKTYKEKIEEVENE